MHGRTILGPALAVAILVALVAALGVYAGETGAQGVEAEAAFDKLKAMAGTWTGQGPDESGAMQPLTHEFRVSANGSVVMETMNPGTGHEMINMYHLDGDDLVLTHYCAGHNQPTMKLDRAHATAVDLPFAFTGGTNLDPAKDHHIHDARLIFRDDGGLDSTWTSWKDGEKEGTITFHLSRAGG